MFTVSTEHLIHQQALSNLRAHRGVAQPPASNTGPLKSAPQAYIAHEPSRRQLPPTTIKGTLKGRPRLPRLELCCAVHTCLATPTCKAGHKYPPLLTAAGGAHTSSQRRAIGGQRCPPQHLAARWHRRALSGSHSAARARQCAQARLLGPSSLFLAFLITGPCYCLRWSL